LPHTPQHSSARLFCAVVVLAPVVAVLAAFGTARSNWFLHRALPPYLTMLDDEFSIRNQHCDVLIFGDSAALTGIMPWAVEQQTGLRTCGIAQTKGSVGVTGTLFLQEYLARNPAPRILVIAYGPENWRPIRQWGDVAYVEGVLQMVRHEPLRTTVPALLRHPNEMFGFVTFVYKQLVDWATGGKSLAVWTAQGEARGGHMTLPKPPETACAPSRTSDAAAFTPVPEFVQATRRQFTTPGTRVVLLSPDLPDCDPHFAMYAAVLNPLLDSPLQQMPIRYYNDVDRHFVREGAEIYSQRVAQILRTVEAQP
jgi:hypothetical protein